MTSPSRGQIEQSSIDAARARDIRLGKLIARPILLPPVVNPEQQPEPDLVEEPAERLTILSIEEIVDVAERVREMRGQAMYSARDICRDVAIRHGLTLEELRSPRRARKYIEPRQEAAYLLCRLTSLSFPAIGKLLDRDHTSVIHAVRQYIKRHGLPPLSETHEWAPRDAEASAIARQREDMVLKYLDQGFDAKQIAARLGTTVNAVRGITYRARQRAVSEPVGGIN